MTACIVSRSALHTGPAALRIRQQWPIRLLQELRLVGGALAFLNSGEDGEGKLSGGGLPGGKNNSTACDVVVHTGDALGFVGKHP